MPLQELLSAFLGFGKEGHGGLYIITVQGGDVEKGKDPERLERRGESSRAEGWEKVLER
jgi:hypothetical protein